MGNFLHNLRTDKALRFRVEKYFWIAMVLPTVVWLRTSVLWVSLLSIYALIITCAAGEEAAEAKIEATK